MPWYQVEAFLPRFTGLAAIGNGNPDEVAAKLGGLVSELAGLGNVWFVVDDLLNTGPVSHIITHCVV